jgi:hypothetical protein
MSVEAKQIQCPCHSSDSKGTTSDTLYDTRAAEYKLNDQPSRQRQMKHKLAVHINTDFVSYPLNVHSLIIQLKHVQRTSDFS